MVAGGLEWVGQAGEDALVIMEYARGSSVHDFLGTDDLASERLADGLVAQAHTQDGNLARQTADHIERNPGLIRSARSGRNDYTFRRHAFDIIN